MSSDINKGCYFRLKKEEEALLENLAIQKDELEKISREVWNNFANVHMIHGMTFEKAWTV